MPCRRVRRCKVTAKQPFNGGDAQTAIVVYAGSAHTLVPLSDDLGTSRNLLEARPNGWALTSRQEVHPEEFEELDAFLAWLATKADYDYLGADGTTKSGGFGQFVGYLRWYEEAAIEKLLLVDDFKIVKTDP